MRSLFLYNLTLRSGSFLIGMLFLYLRFVCLIMDAGNFCSRSTVSFKVLVLLPMKALFAFFSPELDKGHEKGSSAANEADIVPLFSPVLEKIFDDDDAKRKPKGLSKLLESVIESEKWQEQEKRSCPPFTESKRKSENIDSRRKHDKTIPCIVSAQGYGKGIGSSFVRPTLIPKDCKWIECEKHKDGLDSLNAIKFPTPAVPKQELPNKVAGLYDLSNAHSITTTTTTTVPNPAKAGNAHSIKKLKKDVQSLPTTAPATRSHKLSGPPPIRRVSVQVPPFHHSRLYVQCGVLKPQMQSQGTTPRIYNHHVPACTHEKSENLVAASPAIVDNKLAKVATVAKSGSFKETKVQSTPLDQGHAKQSSPVMESKKKSENINLRRKVDKKVVLAQGDAKGVQSPFVRPTLIPKDGKSIKSEKRQEQEKRSRHLVMECKKKSEGIESRGKQEKAVVVANRKIQRVVPVVRSLPTLICNDVKPIESEKHHQDGLDSLNAIKFPTPAVPKQELPNKVAGAVDLSNARSVTKPKKDVQSLPTTAPATRSHKLSGPARIRRVSVQVPPFHHSQLYVRCGGLKPQMQSQGTTPRLYNHHVPACTHEKSENLVAASPATVDDEVAKGATVAKSVFFKETKVQSTPLDQGREKHSRPVMESKKKSENINSRRKVVLAQGDAKGVRSPFVQPTLTPKDGKSIKSEKRQEQEKRSRHPVMECKKKSVGIELRRKQEKAVVVTNRKIQRVVPVVRLSPTLIYKDVKLIESEKHHQGHEKQSSPVVKKSKRKPVSKPPVLTADSSAKSRKTTSTLPGAASISTQRSHTAVAPRWK